MRLPFLLLWMSYLGGFLDTVGVLWQLVAEDDEGGGAHPEADELHLVLPSLLPHQILPGQ